MYDAGDLKPRVGHRFAFTDEGVRAALTLLRSRRAVGKIIIDIDEN
jgi:NADPH:quinone reductase-like Zn-dependent oxidoreductase